MDSKGKFYVFLGIAVAVGGSLAAIVYSRNEAVIYFWECTAAIRVCILANAIIFFALAATATMVLLYSPDVIRYFQHNQKKETRKRDVNFRFEEYRDVHNGIIGLTVFNDDVADLEEKTAELIGIAYSKIGRKLMNSIDMLPHQNRILRWHEPESKISSGGHSLIYISAVDDEGVQFGNRILRHNSDLTTWWAGVEIRGKMDGNPIVAHRCCLSFIVRKNILDNNREIWLVGHPTLEANDCDWAVSLRGEEALKWLEENERKKNRKQVKK